MLTPRLRGYVAPFEGLPAGRADADMSLADDGRIVVSLWAGRLIELRGTEVRVLDERPPDVSVVAVDHRGRPLALTAEGALVRFSRRTGWSTLLDVA